MNRDANASIKPNTLVKKPPPVTHPDSQVRAVDRIAFTVLLATAIHFLVWAGFGVNSPEPKARLSSTLHVTLNQVPAEPVTEPVKRIAEQDQQASGIGEHEQEPQTPTAPPPLASSPAVKVPVKVPTEPPEVTEKTTKPEHQIEPEPETSAEATPQITSLGDAQALVARSLEIARLEAEQKALAEQYAKRPRVRTISTLTAKASDDAFYLRQWQEKIERVGNLNYPERIRRENLTGRLRVLVALNPDGSVKEAQILQSSGHPVLDEAALEIVRLAAPFAPFPRSIRERTDILEIIRTWQFGNGNLFGETG